MITIIALFIFIAGFVIGLGAVTVIDIHGFLGRKSSYWTEATTRTHKVTKPLIWLGVFLVTLGGVFYYLKTNVSIITYIHLGILIVLIINGVFLSFSVSPFLLQRERQGHASELLPKKWQRRITFSFIISFLGWWGGLFLLAVHIFSLI